MDFLPVVCAVASNGRNPIMFLPNNAAGRALARGELAIVVDGTHMVARVAKVAINVVTRPGDSANELPIILRRWFGPEAGMPGKRGRVRLRAEGSHIVMEPVPDAQPLAVFSEVRRAA